MIIAKISLYLLKNVNINPKAIECSSCKFWIHIKCNGTTNEEYKIMLEKNLLPDEQIESKSWFCNKCQIFEIFRFGLEDNHDLLNILNSDSIKSLDYLLSYDIASKALNIQTLNQYDVDANIFHNNINGLETKCKNLNQFLSNISAQFDIITVTETLQQKINEEFYTNINLY